MRFNYNGRSQIEGRVDCKTCALPMLGVGEDDWSVEYLSLSFCKCPEPKLQAPTSEMIYGGECLNPKCNVVSIGSSNTPTCGFCGWEYNTKPNTTVKYDSIVSGFQEHFREQFKNPKFAWECYQQAEKECNAYKKAKEENDERFQLECNRLNAELDSMSQAMVRLGDNLHKRNDSLLEEIATLRESIECAEQHSDVYVYLGKADRIRNEREK